MGKKVVIATGFVIAMAGTSVVRAQNNYNAPMMQYLGYTQLVTQLGANLADGSNVSAAQVESGGYLTLTDGRFSDKTLIETETSTTTGNSHATNCGAEFFGNLTGYSMLSVAPHLGGTSGGSSVQLYTAGEFDGAFLLSPGSPEPYGSNNNARVASHTYTSLGASYDTVARLDYLEQRDDFVQVLTNNFYGTYGDSMNGVVVVSTDGTTTTTDALGGVYTAGRVSPTVTGPWSGSPSDAIGQVSGVVGLLESIGKLTHSNYSYTTANTIAVTAPYTGSSFTTYAKSGYTVHSGDTSEVVKAALMAGALRNVATYTNGAITINGITNYAITSSNNLDLHWGAGMVNAYNSYMIIKAGETDSAQDAGGHGGGIGQYGFDYDPHFGGSNGSNTTAQYGFTAGSSPGKFMVTLAWNVKVAGASTPGGNFNDATTLYNLTLTLTDITANTVVQTSASMVDNTQNIWTSLTAGDQYMLTVNGLGSAFDWDYGLAWRSEGSITALAVPEPTAISLISLGAAGLLRRRRVAK